MDAKIIKRFESYIMPEPMSGCWLWTGYCAITGYGQIGHRGVGRENAAHRLSYLIYKGAIPKGLFVRHTCDNPPCVNPDHLELGTPNDNSQDMVRRGRHQKGEDVHNSMLSNEEVLCIIKMKKDGFLIKDISSHFKISECAVSSILVGRNWSRVTGIVYTKGKRNRKFTEEQVKEIRRLRKLGVRVKTVMSKFGISKSYVSQLTNKLPT